MRLRTLPYVSSYVGEQLRDKLSLLNKSGIELFLGCTSLLPQDCLSIGYVLASIAVSYKGKFEVYLGGCSLGDTSIKILMESLCRSLDPHSEISGHLNIFLTCNDITDEGASYIAEALRTTRASRKLDLDDNPIGDKELQYIAEALTTNTSLIELNLRGCSLRITEENGPALTEMLQRNKALNKLDLSSNEAISDNQVS